MPPPTLLAAPAREAAIPIPSSGIRISRHADRWITFGGLAVAALYLGAAATSLALPPALRLGSWLPAHLALAGAASTAIAAVLPFFTTALVVAPPARPAVRLGGIALVAGGALGAIVAWHELPGQAIPAALAGGSFLVGIALVAIAAFGPLGRSLGPRRRIVEAAYGLALANVAVGVTIATLLVGGNDAVGSAWGHLKPAHAWLNLVGFAGLVVVATLLHLAPTVAGGRMRPRASGRLAIVGVGLGAPLVAAGYAVAIDALARGGAIAVLLGAAGVAGHAIVVTRDVTPGRWTTDAGWHRLTAGALLGGQAWLAAGLAVAAVRTLAGGADPAAWSLAAIGGPLIVGGIVQLLIGSMTHLVPAIGPGDAARHAAQRRRLGTAAAARTAATNIGTALLALGGWLSAVGPWAGVLAAAGLALAAVGIGASLGLLVSAAVSRTHRSAAVAGATPRGR